MSSFPVIDISSYSRTPGKKTNKAELSTVTVRRLLWRYYLVRWCGRINGVGGRCCSVFPRSDSDPEVPVPGAAWGLRLGRDSVHHHLQQPHGEASVCRVCQLHDQVQSPPLTLLAHYEAWVAKSCLRI